YINTKPDAAPVDTDFKNAMLRNIPWGRFGTPAEVAETVLYLASAMADYVTGEVFAVNGGAFAGRAYLPFNKPTAR
ncbi:MAG TPA: SDR family oxidoreductase, partial [Acetobacteraceae bacterium]|nr:SDR family oxidoreductase [Acetobacteraceae bacterium]